MTAYYNENDPKTAAWLRELIKVNLIAPGIVDERSIEDVIPNELTGFTQCHFFAGIGVWSYALRCAGWPDDRPVWTGSCPCQPFSAAGKGDGIDDERHLWPSFYWLIRQCKPAVLFGEQVASKDGLAWLDIVQSDLEAEKYAVAPFDLCAAGFGAPHIRQRLYFVADSESNHQQRLRESGERTGRRELPIGGHSPIDELAFAEGQQPHRDGNKGRRRRKSTDNSKTDLLGDPESGGLGINGSTSGRSGYTDQPKPTNGHWADVEWLYCRDGKYRPTQPGLFPLAHGAANRVVKLRGYGNAIVAPQAEEFIRAYLEYTHDTF